MDLCLLAWLSGLSSCASQKATDTYAKEVAGGSSQVADSSTYTNAPFIKYQFQSSKILSPATIAKLNLQRGENIQYVLFAQFTRNFMEKSGLRKHIYLIGQRRITTEDQFQTQQEYYDLFLVIEKKKVLGEQEAVLRKFSLQENTPDKASRKQHSMKEFFLSVQDFSGDGLDDLFFSFELNRRHGQYHYYLYSFQNRQLTTLVRPWDSFSPAERSSGKDKDYSPFMREVDTDIYPAFVAEIEVESGHTINIDLSSIAENLIRNKVYNKQGMVLRKRGVPHLDFNPILFPVYHNISDRYMLRSVQQVRNRYGQIGIFMCNWAFEDGRWTPDENTLEFLTKPRI